MGKSALKVYLSKSKIPKAGRGVFAVTGIKQGEIIERCPIIETPVKDYSHLRKTELKSYYFLWNRVKAKGDQNLWSKKSKVKIKDKKAAIALGYGSLYNHSYQPNATYKKKFKEKVIDFIAICPIKKGEEITVNYNLGDPTNTSSLWIKSIKPPRGFPE